MKTLKSICATSEHRGKLQNSVVCGLPWLIYTKIFKKECVGGIKSFILFFVTMERNLF